MKWNDEAEAAIKKVPFFVRKRVRARVEEEADREGRRVVTLADVQLTQQRYLNAMEKEVRGYQVDNCFGPNGCPNRAVGDSELLVEEIEALLKAEDILGFLQSRVSGKLKFHHEFRVTVADCPNACSQPQIKDIGIIGASFPEVTGEDCSECEACVDACRDDAITLSGDPVVPIIDPVRCMACGQCAPVCPTGTIEKGRSGYRIQLGGKLGRHPQLARELDGIYSREQVLDVVKDCIRIYKERSDRGQRFGELLHRRDLEELAARHNPSR